MEGTPRTPESDLMQFCVIAIETAALKMGIPPQQLTQRLEAQGLIEGRLMKYYSLPAVKSWTLSHKRPKANIKRFSS